MTQKYNFRQNNNGSPATTNNNVFGLPSDFRMISDVDRILPLLTPKELAWVRTRTEELLYEDPECGLFPWMNPDEIQARKQFCEECAVLDLVEKLAGTEVPEGYHA